MLWKHGSLLVEGWNQIVVSDSLGGLEVVSLNHQVFVAFNMNAVGVQWIMSDAEPLHFYIIRNEI